MTKFNNVRLKKSSFGAAERKKYYRLNEIYHRYACTVSFLNIKLQVDAQSQNEASELATIYILKHFEAHLKSSGQKNSMLTQLLTNKNVIKSILDVTYEDANERGSGIYSSNIEEWGW